MSNKLFDCIIFFRENFITNIRFEKLHNYVDYFVICVSIYDHNWNKKNLNFKLDNKNFLKKNNLYNFRISIPKMLTMDGKDKHFKEISC